MGAGGEEWFLPGRSIKCNRFFKKKKRAQGKRLDRKKKKQARSEGNKKGGKSALTRGDRA